MIRESKPRDAASPAALGHGAAALGCGLLLWAVGQPIFTDDLWWHLALGRAFAEGGPWLAADPLLFAPAGPPAPASWLADLALAGVAHAAGFGALRALHVALVAAILALAWFELRRASRSRAVASLGTLAFAALSAYRLVQLRPDLFSIAASLLFYRWLLADGRPPSWRRIALTSAIAALWANLHAGFPIGLALIAAALAGLVVAAPLRSPEQRRADRMRARRLGAALVSSGAATLANPAGVGAHLAYFRAGAATPSLARVVDEWTPLHLSRCPRCRGRPPRSPGRSRGRSRSASRSCSRERSRAIAVRSVSIRRSPRSRCSRSDSRSRRCAFSGSASSRCCCSARRSRARVARPQASEDLSPSAGRAPRAIARRRSPRRRSRSRPPSSGSATGPRSRAACRRPARAMRSPIPLNKYYSHAIWLLADSGVRGNLYNEYFLGGFAGYWLAPGVRSMVNGTLNFPSEIFDAWGAIAQRRGQRPGEDFPALLDRLGIDLFLGIGMPEAGLPGRRRRYWIATTTHLEDTPGWIPIFRNLECAIYLRANERNRENLDRLARYFGEQHVPFDRERGFEVDAVLRDAPEWAIRHGVVPRGFVRAAHAALTGRADAAVRDRVAALYALLGRYERAAEIDRSLLGANPKAVRVRRRLVWSLLSLGRVEEAAAAAAALEAQPEADGLSHRLARAAREARGRDAAEVRASLVGAAIPLPARSRTGWSESFRRGPGRPANELSTGCRTRARRSRR